MDTYPHVTSITRYLNTLDAPQPYHNIRHIHGMHAIAVTLLASIKHNAHDRYVLDHACLFHDLGHSGGELTDDENIKLAVKHFLNYSAKLNHKVAITEDVSGEIIKAINCTQFPFVHEPTTTVEKCIRDADILYATLHSDPSVIINDLRSEINLTRINKGLHAISVGEMIRGQYEFMQFVNMYTEEGKRLFEIHCGLFLSKLDSYFTN